MLNRDELVSDIRVQLGEEFVPVELGEKGMDAVVRRTIEVYSRYKPLTRHESFKVIHSGMHQHICDADVVGVKSIDLIGAMNQSIINGMAIESAMLSGAPIYYGVGDTFMDIQYLDLRRRWIKTIARELAADPDYAVVIDPETNRVSIFTFATQGLYVDAEVTIPFREDLGNIPKYSQKWFFDWAMTEAQLIVGAARGKFDKIPVAGTSVRLNGPELVAQATAKQAVLIDQMERMRVDLFPRWA